MNFDEHTITEKRIAVGDGHELYTQLWGSKESESTILFLHGGPGSGCNDGHKKFFNPLQQKVLFIDQRGSGLSTPKGSVQNNTTQDLVEDIVKVAAEYNIQEFIVTGGSWGSTLALALTIKYPEMVKALVLRGVFTARQQEIEFLDKGGVRTFFPDVWEEYVSTVPKEFSENPSSYHGPRILGDDQVAAKQSAYAYSNLEAGVMRLDDRTSKDEYETFDPLPTILEYFYLANSCFLEDGELLASAKDISCPTYIVQGRYDAVCPPHTAYDLHKAITHSQLIWTTAGHSGGDRSNWETVKSLLCALT